ncbi:MAG: cation diffusion facilitator family transporter [Coriobacteriales bacterium]
MQTPSPSSTQATHKMSAEERTKGIRKVLTVALLLNIAVSLAKIITGVLTNTLSVRADGIHSIFDGAGSLAGLIGVSLAARPADEDHPYGHSKYETTASLIIGLMLLVAAFNVGSGAVDALLNGSHTQPSTVSIVIMVVTLCINICLSTYERRAGKRLGSSVLGADSKHTLSDALVSISVIVGLVFVNLGFPIADAIATVLVTGAICVTAFEVLRDVNRTFNDSARIEPEKLRTTAMEVRGVVQAHEIRTRGLENEVYVDMHVLVDPNMSIGRAHEIAAHVEEKVQARFPQVCEVMVHLEPATVEELHCPLLEGGLAEDPYGREM